MGTAMLKPPLESLSAQTLVGWQDRMGYSDREASEKLGCSRNAWAGWKKGEHPVPRYIGLACAALALGMTPYGELRKEDVGS